MKSVLEPYKTCNFSDDLQVVKVDSLSPGVTFRGVDTITGSRRIDMTAEIRAMFAYPDSDFYANVKVESLPSSTYAEEKKSLVDNWQYMHMTSSGTTLNYGLKTPLHDFEIQGFDRDKLEGGVLGIYLMFDDKRRVVTTLYLLNQDPAVRKFKTIEEYGKLRDAFLNSYSSCIRSNQH